MKRLTQNVFRVLAVLCVLALPMLSQHANAAKPQFKGKININTASPEQLRLLPRVGPKIAMRILKYRTKQKFRTTKELRKVKGIGAKTFAKMKNLITVGKPTQVKVTAKPKAAPKAKAKK